MAYCLCKLSIPYQKKKAVNFLRTKKRENLTEYSHENKLYYARDQMHNADMQIPVSLT